jgi:hypothetical protein
MQKDLPLKIELTSTRLILYVFFFFELCGHLFAQSLSPEMLSNLYEIYRNEIENPYVLYTDTPFQLEHLDLSDETLNHLDSIATFRNERQWQHFIDDKIDNPIDEFLLQNTIVFRNIPSRLRWSNRFKGTDDFAIQSKVTMGNELWQIGAVSDMDLYETTPFDHSVFTFSKSHVYENIDIVLGGIKLNQSNSFLMASAFGFPANSPSSMVRMSPYKVQPFLSTSETAYLNGVGMRKNRRGRSVIFAVGYVPEKGRMKEGQFFPDLDGIHSPKTLLQKRDTPFSFAAINIEGALFRFSMMGKTSVVNHHFESGFEMKSLVKSKFATFQSSLMATQIGRLAGNISLRLKAEAVDIAIQMNTGNGTVLRYAGKEGYDGSDVGIALKMKTPFNASFLTSYTVRLDSKVPEFNDTFVREGFTLSLYKKWDSRSFDIRYRQKSIEILRFNNSEQTLSIYSAMRHDFDFQWLIFNKIKRRLKWHFKLANQENIFSWALNTRFEHQQKSHKISLDIWRFVADKDVKLYGTAPEVGLPVRLLMFSGDGWRGQILIQYQLVSGLSLSSRVGFYKTYVPTIQTSRDAVFSLVLDI